MQNDSCRGDFCRMRHGGQLIARCFKGSVKGALPHQQWRPAPSTTSRRMRIAGASGWCPCKAPPLPACIATTSSSWQPSPGRQLTAAHAASAAVDGLTVTLQDIQSVLLPPKQAASRPRRPSTNKQQGHDGTEHLSNGSGPLHAPGAYSMVADVSTATKRRTSKTKSSEPLSSYAAAVQQLDQLLNSPNTAITLATVQPLCEQLVGLMQKDSAAMTPAAMADHAASLKNLHKKCSGAVFQQCGQPMLALLMEAADRTQLQGFGLHHLCRLLCALVGIPCEPTSMQSLLQTAIQHMEELGTQAWLDRSALSWHPMTVSMLMWAFSRHGYEGDPAPLVAGVVAAVDARIMEGAKPQAWANTLWAAAKLGVPTTNMPVVWAQGLTAMQQAAEQQPRSLHAQDISNVVLACAVSGYTEGQDSLAVAVASSVTAGVMRDASSQHWANLLWGATHLQLPADSLQAAWEQAVPALTAAISQGTCPAQAISQALCAAATSQQYTAHPELVEAVAAAVEQHPKLLASGDTSQLSVILWSLSELQDNAINGLSFANPDAITGVVHACTQQIQVHLEAQGAAALSHDMAAAVSALSKLGLFHPTLFSAATTAQLHVLSESALPVSMLAVAGRDMCSVLLANAQMLTGSAAPVATKSKGKALKQLVAGRTLLHQSCTLLIGLRPSQMGWWDPGTLVTLLQSWGMLLVYITEQNPRVQRLCMAAAAAAFTECSRRGPSAFSQSELAEIYTAHMEAGEQKVWGVGAAGLDANTPLMQAARAAWQAEAAEGGITEGHREVHHYLQQLGYTATLEAHTPTTTPTQAQHKYEPILVDMLVTSGPKKQQCCVAVICDGPARFLRQPRNMYNGSTALRNRQLRRRVQLVLVPYTDWDQLGYGPESMPAKIQYLKTKMQTALA